MRKAGKRLLSAALAVCLGLGLLTAPALAEDSAPAPQMFTLTTLAAGREDAKYDVTYTASLTVDETLAKILAVNHSDTEKLEALRFTCTLTDAVTARLDSVSESDFTFNGGAYFTLVSVGKSPDGSGIEIVYRLNESKVASWKDAKTEDVKADIQSPTLTMSATKVANNSQITAAMDGNHQIVTSGAVELSMEGGGNIPYFGGTAFTLAEADANMRITHSVIFMNGDEVIGYETGASGETVTAPAFTGSENFAGWNDLATEGEGKTLAPGGVYAIGYENVVFFAVFQGQIDVTIDGLKEGQTMNVSLREAEETVDALKGIDGTTQWPIRFSNVPYGIYNLVAEVYDGDGNLVMTVTRSVELNSSQTDVAATLPRQSVNTVVTGGVHAAPETLESAVSDGEKQELFSKEDDASITITLIAEDASQIASTNSAGDDIAVGKANIIALAGENGHILTDYVDVTIKEEITVNGTTTEEKYLSTTPAYQTIYFRVSAALYQQLAAVDGVPKDNLVVYRDHDGHEGEKSHKTDLLPKVNASAGPSVKAECYFIQKVEDDYYIGVRTNTFSLYAFGVSPTAVSESDLSASSTSTRYEISVDTVAHGTVTANRSTATAGTTITLTVTPDSGYRLESLTVTDRSGNPVAVTANGDGTYSFAMPRGRVTVTPTWAAAVNDPEGTGISAWLDTDAHNAFMIGGDTGDFLPEDDMTRAQAAMVFYRLLRDRNVEAAAVFDDVPEDAWYAEAVNTLAALGMVEGCAEGIYAPDRAITRAEFATIAARFAHASTDSIVVFSDVAETDWSYPYITTAASYGWIVGSGGAFFPTKRITRVEAATIVNRMLGRLCDEDAVDAGAGTRFPDVSETHWGFYQIVEATTTHDYTMNSDRSKETWIP